jgi:EAL domain-containing protein (putative c-di-GMP-specific phosphodiesterase class I)
MDFINDIQSENIIPYFQPIFAADTGKIYAYEVLGRHREDDGNIMSLGPFFSSASNEDALAVDRIIRERALRQFASEGTGEYLFINIRLIWIAHYADNPEELPTIKFAREFGIPLKKLVIEITEEEFCDNSEDFTKVIAYYKSVGCRIAIDDYGSKANDIDRLALISPDILKIDISYIQRSETSYHYREYIRMLTAFAELVGIEVLYEGIETPEQLDICIASKGRFYQGFILARPQPSIQAAVADFEIFSASIDKFVKSLQDTSSSVNDRYKFWDAHVENFFNEFISGFSVDDMDNYLSNLCGKLLTLVKRVYLCNRQGDQLSQNIEVDSGKIIWNDCRNKNWAWRNFFQEAMAALGTGRKSYLTDVYRDVSSKEEIYTYVYQIHHDIYLFIDIMLGGKVK